jgi:hypothetical protein
MKTRIRIFLVSFLMALFFLTSLSSFAEEPDPPILPGQHGAGGDVSVGAPLDNEVIFLLVIGAAYGAYRISLARKAKMKEEIVN